MSSTGWMEELSRILSQIGDSDAAVDHKRLRPAVNAYLIRSHDGHALQFSLPVVLRDLPPLPRDLPPAGIDGAVHAMIEEIKAHVRDDSALHPLGGIDTTLAARYAAFIEPVTYIHSAEEIGQMLWAPDEDNFIDAEGLHLEIHGAVRYPGPPDAHTRRQVEGMLRALLDSIAGTVGKTDVRKMEGAWLASADQKLLRSRLDKMGLVSFIADGSRIARQFTRYRPYFRVAGPKEGVHIPFSCPPGASPVEIELPATGDVVTGLGIRRGEVLAITGSNAEGKTTLIQGILAGEDDHAPGDGRERMVTLPGAGLPRAGSREMDGEDISLFFSSLPPGVGGTPDCVRGHGSGSMVMAAQIRRLLDRGSPLLLIDEDSAATNLLVPCATQSDGVTPLADLIATRREVLKGAAVVVAAATMDYLTASADRILTLEDHRVTAIDRDLFRRRLRMHYRRLVEALDDGTG